ncbi:unnamed protein product [Rotaria magnacalcarata]|uniref:Uncharacterized protein n=1 Tax=Rotaria magnacalcarata TaxID=392030 RepID=A0A816LJ42_9BILA|nr:unnamed protein product [Rotaria magnacalcarata]
MNFLVEVLETTEVTRGLYEKELIDKTVEFNVPHVIHADMKRDEEAHRQHSEGIHQAARMTQLEYSRVLADIPTDFNVLGLELGRAVISLFKSFSTVISSSKNGRYLQKSQSMSEKHEAESLANNQILNFASCFAQSLDSLIERISSNESQTEHVNELQSFKAIFSAGIKDQLEISVDEIKPLLVAEQFSKHNHAPSSISTQGASSKNEVLIAQIVQVRLGDQYVTYVAAMEQIRTLTRKIS